MTFIFLVKFWLIVGLCLSILEVFSGLFIALSFGIAGFVMAGVLAVWPSFLTEWYEVVFTYSVISLIISSVAWKVFGKNLSTKHDIND